MSGDPALRALARGLLEAMIEELEADAALSERARKALGVSACATPERSTVMTPREYAKHSGVSQRTLAYYRAEMREGVHFRREGRKRGRVFFLVEAADAWRAARSCAANDDGVPPEPVDDGDVVQNEIVRRLARNALLRTRNRT